MRTILKMLLAVVGVTAVGAILTPIPVIPEAYAVVPEPSSMALMAAGLGLAAYYRKARKRK